ncbi:MAG: 3-deoxy-7-phosphoheptulonate synthase [Candidatus Accumulibacter sp.]|jgi:3-deoxy-7-phosphoheptulonate synthase|nr:3-deoxy-7-phosphoheptulonate synthase [Accumulibacter sp.]
MIIVLKHGVTAQDVEQFSASITEQYAVKVNAWYGEYSVVLGLLGDTSVVDLEAVAAQNIVASVKRVQEPYKKASRHFHPEDSLLNLGGGARIGGGALGVIAGPCSVESEEQIVDVARRVKAAGASFLRGGAFKPRTSPYAFQGLRAQGLELLRKARQTTGLPIVTEIMAANHLALFEDVDVIQVGARNMQNFELLKELGKMDKPILLKRGLANTIEELLMSAEYIMAAGNERVILCERGIRTFETMTRNTLDVSAIPLLKEQSHLPVVVDPSHASGMARLVEPLSMAAIAAGADGLIIEVHNDPPHALCDGPQSLTPPQFDALMEKIRRVAPVLGRTLSGAGEARE